MNAAARPVTPSRRVVSTLIVAALWFVLALPLLIPGFQCPSARYQHRACPGCGLTRACVFIFHGDFAKSFAMHPLAIPTVLSQSAFAVATLVLAWRVGAPYAAFEERLGRITLFILMGVMMADFILWLARGCGAFGGPVPI